VFRQAITSTDAEQLTSGPTTKAVNSVLPDGSAAIVRETATNFDLMLLPLTKPYTMRPLVKTAFLEQNGEVSRDGRWIAYESNDSGQFEIYVQPFPDMEGRRWQVSTQGGTQPLWSRDGRELFYRAPDNAVMSQRVTSGSAWDNVTPVRLFGHNQPVGNALGGTARTYDEAPDGRFVIINLANSQPGPKIVLVRNWFEELKRLAPRK
jgi:serine/threonine-protein kinase